MQAVQIALFVVVAVLALALLGYLTWPRWGRRVVAAPTPSVLPAPLPAAGRTAGPPPLGSPEGAVGAVPESPLSGVVCPACRREYPSGLRYCPYDARALLSAGDPAARAPGTGVTCPSCKRSYEANKRYCPYDAEELMPMALAMVAGRSGGALPRVLGKICPSCAQRYELEATFCGRDGSELVSVN